MPVLHTDVGFDLLFGTPNAATLDRLVADVARPFPAGLMTPIGMVVANPVYADQNVWSRFGDQAGGLLDSFTDVVRHSLESGLTHVFLLTMALEAVGLFLVIYLVPQATGLRLGAHLREPVFDLRVGCGNRAPELTCG